MKILAIDTTSKICSVTILENKNVLINLHNDDEKTHSVKLMPMVNKAFKETNLSLDDINLLVCCIGPGSFTGVRIGIATIKAFADVKNIPIVGVTSLEGLAYNMKNIAIESNLVCSLIDAKNNNVYCGLYQFIQSNNSCNYNSNCKLISIGAEDIDTTIEKVNKIISANNFKQIIFVGDGAIIYKEKLSSHFENVLFATDNQNLQNGISIGLAGLDKYLLGEYGDSSSISPIYLRKSQAERELEKKIKILPMTLDDIKLIKPNFESNFDRFWNITNLENDFNNPNSSYFIAKLDNEVVGFAGMLKICDEANIMNIVTKVDKRHLGIGAKLLDSLIESSKKHGLKSITLEVKSNNYPAINLYEKFNFKRIGLRKKYYNNTDDAIIMTLFFK